jgi:hypothetical protein
MCFMLYAGTTKALPLKGRNKDTPGLSVRALKENEADIRVHFSLPEVQNIRFYVQLWVRLPACHSDQRRVDWILRGRSGRPQDSVLLIGDTRQHQGVEAGKPFEQLQQAGMRTAQLDQIVRQKAPELLKAVEHLAKNETKSGIELLRQQGRVTELADPQQRIAAIAKSYALRPENTLIVSPDNASRQAINQAIRVELQEKGTVAKNESTFLILTPRSEMTGADRAWAQKYQTQDVLHYSRGSKEHGIERGSYTTVVAVNPKNNLLTVRRDDGEQVTYDPRRLQGITAYREREREFSQGDRIQFTAPDRNLHVANRMLATVEKIDGPQLTVKMGNRRASSPSTSTKCGTSTMAMP